MKRSTNLLTTTVIGGWPKPSWLSSGRHDSYKWSIDLDWSFQGEELGKKQDEATEWALHEQELTGVDIVSDGEQRRDNYIYYHCRHLDGFYVQCGGRSGRFSFRPRQHTAHRSQPLRRAIGGNPVPGSR